MSIYDDAPSANRSASGTERDNGDSPSGPSSFRASEDKLPSLNIQQQLLQQLSPEKQQQQKQQQHGQKSNGKPAVRKQRVKYVMDRAMTDPDEIPRYESLFELRRKKREQKERERIEEEERMKKEQEERKRERRRRRGENVDEEEEEEKKKQELLAVQQTAAAGEDEEDEEAKDADKLFEQLRIQLGLRDERALEQLKREALLEKMKYAQQTGKSALGVFLKEKIISGAKAIEKFAFVRDEIQVFLDEETTEGYRQTLKEAEDRRIQKDRQLRIKNERRQLQWELQENHRIKKIIFLKEFWKGHRGDQPLRLPLVEDDAKYEGPTLNAQKHGLGQVTKTLGDKYVGSFENGRPHGFGFLKCRDGSEYSGQWNIGARDGLGRSIFTGGSGCYHGQWQDNVPHGLGVEHSYTKDKTYFGQYQSGQKHGLGIVQFHTAKQLQFGRWYHGEKHGIRMISQTVGLYGDIRSLIEDWEFGKLISREEFDGDKHPNDIQDQVMWVCQEARRVALTAKEYSAKMEIELEKGHLGPVILQHSDGQPKRVYQQTPNDDPTKNVIRTELREFRRFIPLVQAIDSTLQDLAMQIVVNATPSPSENCFYVNDKHAELVGKIEKYAAKKILKSWRNISIVKIVKRTKAAHNREIEAQNREKFREEMERQKNRTLGMLRKWNVGGAGATLSLRRAAAAEQRKMPQCDKERMDRFQELGRFRETHGNEEEEEGNRHNDNNNNENAVWKNAVSEGSVATKRWYRGTIAVRFATQGEETT